MSASLERDAVYTKTSLIDRLPAYLTVQFVRFYYKEREAVNAKILKDVKFPLQFDAWELCTPRLQALMDPTRNKFKEIEEQKVLNALEGNDNSKPKSSKGPEPMEVSLLFTWLTSLTEKILFGRSTRNSSQSLFRSLMTSAAITQVITSCRLCSPTEAGPPRVATMLLGSRVKPPTRGTSVTTMSFLPSLTRKS
jgi:Ubiquitin carboxyl-terminal hydrolase